MTQRASVMVNHSRSTLTRPNSNATTNRCETHPAHPPHSLLSACETALKGEPLTREDGFQH